MKQNDEVIIELANRAHDTKRGHFISTINLFLTICIGLIAFVFSSFKDIPLNHDSILFLRVGLVLMSLSIICGILASYSQYKHFSYLALYLSHIAAKKDLNNLPEKTENWRKKVKLLFDFQTITMLVSLIFIAVYYVVSLNIW